MMLRVVNNTIVCREDGSPSWGRKLYIVFLQAIQLGREDGSPSWGRKLSPYGFFQTPNFVEKMGPLRGDGNSL